MKSVSLFLALFVVVSFSMFSCGGSTPAAETADTTAVVPAAEPAAEPVADAYVANLENGKVIYDKMCNACHVAGVAGAAKLDNKVRWEETAVKGLAVITEHAIVGYTGTYGVMPAKGGNPAFTDIEVKDALAYMLAQAGVEAK
jgi:cytochrome c5